MTHSRKWDVKWLSRIKTICEKSGDGHSAYCLFAFISQVDASVRDEYFEDLA